MKTIATICARGGSIGVPRKNILPLLGKPLICHTIEQALHTPGIDRVYVSTDCPEIAEVALNSGAEVPFLRLIIWQILLSQSIPLSSIFLSGLMLMFLKLAELLTLINFSSANC